MTHARESRMTLRRTLMQLFTLDLRTPSSVARELGLRRGDVESELPHLLRSARAAGWRITIDPARCRNCGFAFDDEVLGKPGKCPQCRGTRLMEPRLRIETDQDNPS